MIRHLDWTDRSVERRESPVSVEASEMVTVPRAEWDSLRAGVRRLRREIGEKVAVARIQADPGHACRSSFPGVLGAPHRWCRADGRGCRGRRIVEAAPHERAYRR